MSNLGAIIACVIIALIYLSGFWKPHKFDIVLAWLIITVLFYFLGELTTSYKALAIMLKNGG